jgi:LuxR family maltose regulon positive regulatory protein
VLGYAGAGKTVLLASWVAARPAVRSAWLSCDDGDADPLRFWTGIVAAIRRVEPTIGGDTLDRIELDGEVTVGAIGTLSDELRTVPTPLVIVLDDLHDAADDRLSPLLATFVEWLPAAHRLVIASRSEPLLPIHRWRVDGRLTEIRASHLAFGDDEAAALLAKLGAPVGSDIVAMITRRTEGWAAGLQLAGLSVRGRDDAAAFLGDLAVTDRNVVDYLTAEVLDHQPADVTEFLLATSVLRELEARACGALTGDPDPHGRLRDIEARGLFLVPLDDRRGRYRYHHLFADLLRARLRAVDERRTLALHAAAADWYAAEGEVELAVFHAVQAGAPGRAVALLREHLVHDYFSGIPRERSRLLDLLDDDTLRRERALALEFALAVGMNGGLDESVRWLRRLALVSDDRSEPVYLGRLAAARAFLEMALGGAHRGVEHAARARELLEPDDDLARELTIAQTRLCHYLDDHDGVRRLVESDPAAGLQPMAAVVVAGSSGGIELDAGRLDEADRLGRAALAIADDVGTRQHFSVGEALRIVAAVHLERMELDEAESLLERALRIVERERPAIELLCLVEEVWILVERQRIDDALETVARLEALVERVDPAPALVSRVQAASAHLHLLVGAPDEAAATADRMPPGTRRSLTEARVALARDRPDTAAALLQPIDTSWPRHRLEIALLRARTADRLGGSSETVTIEVERALLIADEHRFVRSVVVEGGDLGDPLLRALRRAPASSHRAALARRLRSRVPAPRSTDLIGSAFAPSSRELEILRYLASGLSNREIAAELYISLNTLKTHVKSLYRKIGVSSRSAAVAWGRTRRLL